MLPQLEPRSGDPCVPILDLTKGPHGQRPHRGAPRSRGEVLGDDLACRYHGVRLDGTATIVRVPAMPDGALEGRRPVESFAVGESNDVIFVYFAATPRGRPQRSPGRHRAA